MQLQKYKPTLGMLFDNHEEMWAFQKAYNRQEVFPMKKLTSKKKSNGIIKYMTFACGFNGKSENKSTNMLKPKPIVKTSYDVRIEGCVNDDEK